MSLSRQYRRRRHRWPRPWASPRWRAAARHARPVLGMALGSAQKV